MFGLTIEKLFVIAVFAALVIGPHRLPGYARRLAETVRALRAFVEQSRARAEAEMGVPLGRTEWESLDLRQYDPRRIVREALSGSEPAATTHTSEADAGAGEAADTTDAAPGAVATTAPTPFDAEILAQAGRIRPGQRFLAVGSAAHPRRILIDALPEDDPRRRAAQVKTEHEADASAAAA